MIDVLDVLNARPGITGSLVATSDGMLVAARLGPEWNEEAAAAFTSSLIAGARALLRGAGSNDLARCVLTATRGKVIALDLGEAYLVVTTDRHIDLDREMIEIESAAAALRRRGRMAV